MTEGDQDHLRKTKENFVFLYSFRNSLIDAAAGLSKPRILDFGAGSISLPLTPFSLIKEGQTTIAYDPNVTPDKTPPPYNKVDWTNVVPKGEFDLIVCNFSLHHIVESPEVGDLTEQINKLKETYRPKLIGIADYDFKGKTLEEFRETFIAEGEQQELNSDQFKGNEQACFDFHSRFGLKEYEEALTQNGFKVIKAQHGRVVARNKFFIIGAL